MDERLEARDEFRRLIHAVDETADVLLIPGVRLVPGGPDLRLAARLQHVGPGALLSDGPRADQRLVEQILGMPVRCAVLPGGRRQLRPRVQCFRPAIGDLRQQRDAGPHVLAALVVVRRGGQHVVGPALAQIMAEFVKPVGRNSDQRGLGADLVARHQSVETVERRVLDALRHHGRRQLLPLRDEIRLALVEVRLGEQGQ